MVIQIITDLSEDFLLLESESKLDGFKFLEKMRLEWSSGHNRFNEAGEVVYGIFENNKLVAIGGINIDPYTNESKIGRVRHLYVQRDFRKKGYGSFLVKNILTHGSKYFSKVRLRTDTVAASAFYENIGFKVINDQYASHVWTY